LRYTAIPEPTSGALMFIGAGVLAVRRRRVSRLARLA
jgi:PEP-CTERM motif/LPXTG cell wall anchor motif